jgi:hypothetical protein
MDGYVSSDKTWSYQERGDFCEASSGKVCTFVHSFHWEGVHKSAHYFSGNIRSKGSVLVGDCWRYICLRAWGGREYKESPWVSPVPHEYRTTGDVGSTVPGVLARSCRIRLGLIRAAAASWRQEAPACRAATRASW